MKFLESDSNLISNDDALTTIFQNGSSRVHVVRYWEFFLCLVVFIFWPKQGKSHEIPLQCFHFSKKNINRYHETQRIFNSISVLHPHVLWLKWFIFLCFISKFHLKFVKGQ